MSQEGQSAYAPLYYQQGSHQDAETDKPGAAYPPPLLLASQASGTHPEKRKIVIRKWMFALSFLLLVPFAAWIALEVGPITLNRFHKMMEERDVAGSAYWSLFGRDDGCCQWVEHVSALGLSVPKLRK